MLVPVTTIRSGRLWTRAREAASVRRTSAVASATMARPWPVRWPGCRRVRPAPRVPAGQDPEAPVTSPPPRPSRSATVAAPALQPPELSCARCVGVAPAQTQGRRSRPAGGGDDRALRGGGAPGSASPSSRAAACPCRRHRLVEGCPADHHDHPGVERGDASAELTGGSAPWYTGRPPHPRDRARAAARTVSHAQALEGVAHGSASNSGPGRGDVPIGTRARPAPPSTVTTGGGLM